MSPILAKLERIALLLCPIAAAIALVGLGVDNPSVWRNAAVAGFLALALGIGSVTTLRTFRFTAWIAAAVAVAMVYPTLFQPFGLGTPRDKLLLLVLIQAVMFGMGTQITLADFAGVARQPWPVAVGLVCQFTIMPLVGYTLAVAFRLPPEIGAGMVLIGACSSGLSSNVMAYIARANLALSITMTAVATMLAPLLTPMWMKLLAAEMLEGAAVPMSFLTLMAAIIKIVIVPTGAALIHDYLRFAALPGRLILYAVAAIGAVAVAGANLGGWRWLMADAGADAAMWGELLLFLLGGVAFGVAYHGVATRVDWIDKAMPAVAMAGITYVTGMTSAAGRDELMVVGLTLCIAAALHNVIGYVLGYWLSRAVGLDQASCRTVAFEVGLQNGGMATGLASAMGKLGTLGLPAAFFIAWMNVSGSLLANFWRRRPLTDETTNDATTDAVLESA